MQLNGNGHIPQFAFAIRYFQTGVLKENECVPSEDSDQPGHPPSLIRVFAVH